MFNSLKYAKILEGAGIPRGQAEIHIQILSDVIGEEMATQESVRVLKSEIMATKEDVREIGYKLQSLEHRITLKLGGLMAAFLATGLTAAKLLFV